MSWIDASDLEPGSRLDADICIVGSGPAALAVATRLIPTSASVLLLEGGLDRYDRSSQSVYRGERRGAPQRPLHRSRARRYGGTGAIWSGRTRPLDPEDLTARPWIPHSGWPLRYDDLASYYPAAAAFCGVEWTGDHQWADRLGPRARLESSDLEVRRLGCDEARDFGAVFRDTLGAARRVRAVVGAGVLALRAGAGGDRVDRVEVATSSRARLTVRASRYVIACGGIENARLLLASNDVVSEGLGNEHDRVGRCFMDHPYVMAGRLVPGDNGFPVEAFTFDGHRAGRRAHGLLALSRSVMAREGLLAAAAHLARQPPPHVGLTAYGSPAVRSAREIVDDLRHGERPDRLCGSVRDVLGGTVGLGRVLWSRASRRRPVGLGVRIVVEQAPDPANRITLTRARDRFGVPRVAVTWRLGSLEHRTLARMCDLLATEFRGRLGTLHIDARIARGEWPPSLTTGCHHSGATRMSDDPREGVVDTRCRVHGVSNLYVAGSSVFPTSGYANPTLTIVALSLRLGDELGRP